MIFDEVVSSAEHETLSDGVDFFSFGNLPILVLVPHAGGESLEVSSEGKKVTFNVEETNTDLLGAIAAKSIGANLLVSRVPRNRADFARNPDLLGKEMFAQLGHSSLEKPFKIKTHQDISYKQALEKFHKKIETLNPKFIMAFHGMRNRRFDVLLGFGKQRQYIKGIENSRKFKQNVIEKLNNPNIKVGISVKKLLGESEYNLKHHVENKRLGVLCEFNYDGRKKNKLSQEYIDLSKAIAKSAKATLGGFS